MKNLGINLILWILKHFQVCSQCWHKKGINLILWILKPRTMLNMSSIDLEYKFDPMDFET